jgi:hypothetical protein
LGSRFDDLMSHLLAKVASERFRSAAEVRGAASRIDFSEIEGEEDARPRELAPPPIRADEPEETFIALEPARPMSGGSARRGQHALLDMAVSLIDLSDVAHLDLLRAFGALTTPFVQRVLDLKAESGEVVVEEPEGELLSERLAASGRLDPLEALQMADHIARALVSIHRAGLTHGEIRSDRVRLGRYRAALLLPERSGQAASSASDTAALIQLLAEALGCPGLSSLDRLLAQSPLAEALGSKRSSSLRAAPTAEPEAAAFRSAISEIRREICCRTLAREHLHALAAAARAAGADPRQGALARFLETRRSELDA